MKLLEAGRIFFSPTTMFADTILIIFISIATALLGEGNVKTIIVHRQKIVHLGLTWLLVYRTEKYQRLKGEVEKASKRCKFFDI